MLYVKRMQILIPVFATFFISWYMFSRYTYSLSTHVMNSLFHFLPTPTTSSALNRSLRSEYFLSPLSKLDSSVHPGLSPHNVSEIFLGANSTFSSRTTATAVPALALTKDLSQVLGTMPPGDILFSFGNKDHLPFHLHWICNTMGWPGLHERAILVTSDKSSQNAIRKLSARVHTFVVPESSVTYGFYSKGYRMLTIRRIAILVEILAAGRGVIMFEGDALWTSNILDDENVAGPNRRHDAALYRDGGNGQNIGAGFMSMRGNRSGAYAMWSAILNQLNKDMKPFSRQPDSTVILPQKAQHEQEILRDHVLPAMLLRGEMKVIDLDRCSYTSGLWYKPEWKQTHRKMCGSKTPAVLNNNYITGNSQKIRRAQDYKHWFLDGDQCLEWGPTLQRAIATFQN